MAAITDFRQPIEQELQTFEQRFKNSMSSKVALLNAITNYLVKKKGKRMRPMFCMYSAALNGSITEKTYRAASLIELLHTATLVHDDVVDESYMRRGIFSINALWKNKIAVLVGDYLLSKGLLLSLENQDFALLTEVSKAVKAMSEGELLQLEKARKLDITEEVYFEIIYQKTASLIATACACGAISAEATDEQISAMREFGANLGIAFQIKDDLFDYGKKAIGKPRGIDIQEKKMTLPLIYTLNKVDNQTKKEILTIVRKENKNIKKVNQVIEIVKDNGGLEYAVEKMHAYADASKAILETFPESDYKTGLSGMIDYTINRKI